MLVGKLSIFGEGKEMSIELQTKHGQIEISIDVIATIAGGAAVDCYGIVGMASKVKDFLSQLLLIISQEIHKIRQLEATYTINLAQVSAG